MGFGKGRAGRPRRAGSMRRRRANKRRTLALTPDYRSYAQHGQHSCKERPPRHRAAVLQKMRESWLSDQTALPFSGARLRSRTSRTCQVCQFFCVNDQVLFLGMGARGKGPSKSAALEEQLTFTPLL